MSVHFSGEVGAVPLTFLCSVLASYFGGFVKPILKLERPVVVGEVGLDLIVITVFVDGKQVTFTEEIHVALATDVGLEQMWEFFNRMIE